MGRYHFRMPDIGEGVAEAEILAWHVTPGDQVSEDQSIFDVMTDKATVDISSPVAGRVVAVHGAVGTMLAIGAVAIEFETEGAGNATEAAGLAAALPAQPVASPPAREQTAEPMPALAREAVAGRKPKAAPLASPATRRRAHESGIPLQFVHGTGPAGRVTRQDLDAYVEPGDVGAPRASAARKGVVDVPIVGLRRKIAQQMEKAKRRIPHIAYVEECDVTELEALRQHLNARRAGEHSRLTLLPFLIRALVVAMKDFPQINANFDDEAGILRCYDGVHVGIATRTDAGLIVPVVRHAEARDLWGLADELGRVSTAARDGSARREELTGSTITVTSLGPLGGIATTPIINHPEVAIVAPNRIVERPVIHAGHPAVRKMMNLSSSFDHRIVDGFDAASFVQGLKRLIEQPALLFLDR